MLRIFLLQYKAHFPFVLIQYYGRTAALSVHARPPSVVKQLILKCNSSIYCPYNSSISRATAPFAMQLFCLPWNSSIGYATVLLAMEQLHLICNCSIGHGTAPLAMQLHYWPWNSFIVYANVLLAMEQLQWPCNSSIVPSAATLSPLAAAFQLRP